MSGEVVVARSDIQKLSKELRMFKNLLSRLTNQDILPHLENLGAVHTGQTYVIYLVKSALEFYFICHSKLLDKTFYPSSRSERMYGIIFRGCLAFLNYVYVFVPQVTVNTIF